MGEYGVHIEKGLLKDATSKEKKYGLKLSQ